MSDRIFASFAAALLLGFPLAAAAEGEILLPGDAVERALKNNPSLAAAVLEHESAGWAVVSEETVFSPRLLADAAVQHNEAASLVADGQPLLSRSDFFTVGVGLAEKLPLGTELALRLENNTTWNRNDDIGGINAVGPLYDTAARLTLTQPLLRGAFSVNTAALRIARSQQTEAQRTALQNASALVRDTLTAWLELWYADESLRIERESLRVAEAQRDEAKRRVELGLEAPVSVLAFETRVAERLESVAVAERARKQQALALGALLGDASPTFNAGDAPLPVAEGPVATDPREAALRSSPDVLAAEASLKTSEIQASVAADPSRPRLDVGAFAEVGKLAPSFVGLGGGDTQNAWSAGVNLTFELPLDGREREAAVAQARLSLAAAQRQLEQAKLTVDATVQQQVAAVESARTRVQLAKQTTEVAEKQLKAEQARYATGTSTTLDVLQAEEDVRNARLRLARAEVDLRSATASVDHETGALLDRWLPGGLASL